MKVLNFPSIQDIYYLQILEDIHIAMISIIIFY